MKSAILLNNNFVVEEFQQIKFVVFLHTHTLLTMNLLANQPRQHRDPLVLAKIRDDNDLANIRRSFNWALYLHMNPLLSPLLKTEMHAWNHFRKYGYHEGRAWCPKPSEDTHVLVVMPTFNRPHNIESIIEMMLCQELTCWTFLIIDDGSTPENKRLFRAIQQKHKLNTNIVFEENESNCHVANTLNRGIDYLLNRGSVSCTHFTWITDDNVYSSQFLNVLANNNTFFNYTSYSVHNQIRKTHYNVRQKYNSSEHLNNSWCGCASFMWTKQAIESIGFYNETLPGCEDYDYLIRTFAVNAAHCVFIDVLLMTYTIHKMAFSHKNSNMLQQTAAKIKERFLAQKNGVVATAANVAAVAVNPYIHKQQPPQQQQPQHKHVVDAKRRTTSIKIVTVPNLLTCAGMVQNTLHALNFKDVRIIFDIPLQEPSWDADSSFYIIIFSRSKIIPKRFIFWQIEQTSMIESPIKKFNSHHIEMMNRSVAILEMSPDNISFYSNRIANRNKIRYSQLPFSDVYKLSTLLNKDDYLYDLAFFGAMSSRRSTLLHKINTQLGGKFRLKIMSGLINEVRDDILKKTKYVLNIHFYEDATLECDRFNISIHCNCLVLSENCNNDLQNKENYAFFVSLFDKILCDNKNPADVDIQPIIDCIEYNLRDDVFLAKRATFLQEKVKLEKKCTFFLHKSLLSFNAFPELDIPIEFDVNATKPYCISLVEDQRRYNVMMTQPNVPDHFKFEAFKHSAGFIGCAMSYYTLMHNCKRQNIESITLFEDDALFHNNFEERYAVARAFLQHVQWDILNGYCCIIEKESDIIEYHIFQGVTFLKIKKMVGTVFNIYNKSIYNNFLSYDYNAICANPTNRSYTIDSLNRGVNIYICYPSLVSILPVSSTMTSLVETSATLSSYNWFQKEELKTNAMIEHFLKNNRPVEISSVNAMISKKTLVLFVFHIYNERVQHFFDHCLFDDDEIDFIIISNGRDNKFKVPPFANVRTFMRDNAGYDFGGWSEALLTNPELCLKYNNFIFVNSSVMGPFFKDDPAISNVKWTDVYINGLQNKNNNNNNNIKLFGSTINTIENPLRQSHVQSYIFAMDRNTLQYLIECGIFSLTYVTTFKEAVWDKEVQMSLKIIQRGWNIGSLMKYYENVDFTFKTKSPNEYSNAFLNDVMYPQFRGKLWDEFEILFIKGNRINIKC